MSWLRQKKGRTMTLIITEEQERELNEAGFVKNTVVRALYEYCRTKSGLDHKIALRYVFDRIQKLTSKIFSDEELKELKCFIIHVR